MVKRLLPIFLVVCFGFVGYALTITIFPPLMMDPHAGKILKISTSFEMRVILLGILSALYPLGQFVGAPVIGALSDRHGRKPLLIYSLIVVALGYIGISISLVIESLWFLMTSVAITGLASGNVVIGQSVIADITTGEQRTRYFGYLWSSIAFAFIFTPIVGGKLAVYFGYPTPFWTVLGLLIILCLWIGLLFQETLKQKEHVPYLHAFLNLKNVFTDRRIRLVYLINFLIYMGIFGFFRAFAMYIIDVFHYGLSPLSEMISWLNSGILISCIWLTNILLKRLSPRTVTLIGALGVGIFPIIMVLPNQIIVAWALTFFVGLAIGIAIPVTTALLSRLVGEREQGRVLGNNQALSVFAEGISSLFAGFLAVVFVELPIFVYAAFSLLGAIVLAFKPGILGARQRG